MLRQRDRERVLGSPEFVEMAATWMGLRSPMHPSELDHRFAGWFARAEQNADLLEAFTPRLRASANDWLAEYERESSVVTANDESRLRHFDAWADLAARHPRVAAVLSDILGRWKMLQKQRLIAIRTREVEAALGRGDTVAARSELEKIEALQDVSTEKVADLQGAVAELEKRQTEIDAWRSELAGAPRDWRDVARVHDLWAQGRRLAQARGTPREWVETVDRELQHLQSLAIAFISRRAAECLSIDAVRVEVITIREASSGYEWPIDETWLEPLSSAIVRLLDRAIENAEERGDLQRISSSAAAIAAMVPSAGGRQIQEILRRIETIVTAWEAFEADEMPHEIPGGVVPRPLTEHIEKWRIIADRLAAVEQAMDGGRTTAERITACGDAIESLQQILEEVPWHADARALLKLAVARLELLRLDDSIERWDIDRIRPAVPNARSYDAQYASLLTAMPVLEQLAELRGVAFVAADLPELMGWWKSWRDLEALLPAQKPDTLRRALGSVREETAATAREMVKSHLGRTTTIDEDHAAETAFATLAADLDLRDERALTERRTIHAAVIDAQNDGTAALAALLRDHWRTIERYLPWAGTILSEAFERAWEEADDDSLEALRHVTFREKLSRGAQERFEQWLEWIEIERNLSFRATPEHVRHLHACLQRNGSSSASVVRRLARLIEKWRSNGDDAGLTWAYRAFADFAPPLFRGADPLLALTRKSDQEIASIFRKWREAAVVDDAFTEEIRRILKQTENAWERLEQLLLAVPVPEIGPWPAAPPQLREATILLATFQSVLDSIAEWKRSDIRQAGDEWDAVWRLLSRELARYPAAESLERVLRKIEPLTRLSGLEKYLDDACQKCATSAPGDERDVFEHAAHNLEAIIKTLRAAEPEGTFTLCVVAKEYWRTLPQLVGDLLPPDPDGDLDALYLRFLRLHDNDQFFLEAIELLWRQQPNIGTTGEFDPTAHLGYLDHYPQVPPATLRVRRNFDDFAARASQRVILRQSRELLPEWLQTCVDNISRGVSPW
jgi:hypothetical protein